MLSTPARLLLSLALASPAALAQANITDEVNQAFGLLDSDVVDVSVEGELGSAMRLSVELDGAPFAIDLTPYSVRSADFELVAQLADGSYRSEVVMPARTMRGSLAGEPGSRVAGSLLDAGFYGRILAENGDEWWIQPAVEATTRAAASQHVLYRATDVIDDPAARCADALIAGTQAPAAPTTGGTAQLGTLSRAELGCDADFEYYQDYGSSTNSVMNRIETVINTVNLQYESQVDITHDITTILVRTSSNQPYTSSDAGNLLDQFVNQWRNNHGNIQRDVAHLFTGKSINGGTIGIAYLGVICNLQFGYGLVESDFNNNFSCATDLSAHELGHNWNAGHCNCTSNTMNPFITCANNFSNASRNAIIAHRNSRNCLDTGGPGPQVIFSDDFESGNFTAGGWVLQNNRPRVRSAAARNSNFGARIRRESWIERSVSTVGYSSVQVSFARRTRNLDVGEFFRIEYFNGSGYTTIHQAGGNVGWFDFMNVQLPASAANNPNFRFRARCFASQGRERGDIDNVEIVGIP